MAEENTCDLKALKKEYEIFKKKYDLPEFKEINELFDIEDIDIDTDFLLRRIRRVVSERIEGYLKFIDMILNPANAPMFFFQLIKKLDNKDKEEFTEVYEKLGSIEIELIQIELDYSEKNEADFINKYYKSFKDEIKPKLLSIIKKLDNAKESSRRFSDSSYFG
ncbi:MAG: hypothetical protein Q8N99_04185 [Nanoarchaeota archaeon]|nr:hypothetical protein [Nanoarchaeota archaeon]